MVDLRAYVFLDSLQPQFASFQATISKGYLPKVGQASLFLEIAPGMAINHILDVALKATDVTPGMQIVERHYGMLELHSDSQADVRQAGQAILDALGLQEKDRHKPRVVSNEVVRHLEDTQTMLINRFRHGNMILAGQTLFVLEVEPAAYAALAANEAEKAADINILEVRAVGSFGRVYIGGEDRDVVVAHAAATPAIKAVTGRTKKKYFHRFTRAQGPIREEQSDVRSIRNDRMPEFSGHGRGGRRNGQGGQGRARELRKNRWRLHNRGRAGRRRRRPGGM